MIGKTVLAEQSAYDFILSEYKKRPDKLEKNEPPVRSIKVASMVRINEIELRMLLRYQTKGLLPDALFASNKGRVPDGLSSSLVMDWLNSKVKEAKPEHIKWVIQQCQIFSGV